MGSTGDARNCNALQRLAKLHAKESHGNILSAVTSCWPVKKGLQIWTKLLPPQHPWLTFGRNHHARACGRFFLILVFCEFYWLPQGFLMAENASLWSF